MSKRLNKEQFVERAITVHGNRYSYDNVVYLSMSKKVNITCGIHGAFFQTPADHLWRHGCPQCKADKASCNIDDIKQLFLSVHKNRYEYDFSTYTRNSVKMKIICPIHGEFWQKPELHKNGAGCRICTASGGPGKYCEKVFARKPGLKNKHGILYHIKLLDSNKVEYYKIGITTSLRKRFYNYIKNSNGEILWTHEDTLYNCFLEEQKLLESNKEFKYIPLDLKVGGKHECFTKEITNGI